MAVYFSISRKTDFAFVDISVLQKIHYELFQNFIIACINCNCFSGTIGIKSEPNEWSRTNSGNSCPRKNHPINPATFSFSLIHSMYYIQYATYQARLIRICSYFASLSWATFFANFVSFCRASTREMFHLRKHRLLYFRAPYICHTSDYSVSPSLAKTLIPVLILKILCAFVWNKMNENDKVNFIT